MKPEIQTSLGGMIDLADPKPEMIDIRDIANALSKLCRYTGHCRGFYSVAQHSVLVSRVLPEGLRLHGLMHDASEAYLGDVSSPLKAMLPDYRAVEKRMQSTIYQKYGMDTKEPAKVKQADIRMLATEVRDLMYNPDWEILKGVELYNFRIHPWDADYAYCQFMNRWYQLTEEK